MSRPPYAWVFNLDAELELAHGAGYWPARSVSERIAREVTRIETTLPAGDRIVGQDADVRGMEGRAWCPTPSALARLEAGGARILAAPSLAVLRAANDRALSFRISRLPGATVVGSIEAFDEVLARLGRVRVKRTFTFAGRGHRRVDRTRVDPTDHAFVAASLPVYVEPRVEVELELTLHGLLAEDGRCERGQVVVQRVDANGQWQDSYLATDEHTQEELAALERSFHRVGASLAEIGYFGPFGIDAFRYRLDGVRAFQPVSEINARYSRGWAVGMGGWR